LFVEGGGKVISGSMERTIMWSIALFRVFFAVFLIAFPTVHLAATPCWGSDQPPAEPTITLNADNEPLQSVFAKISKTTLWKIQAPNRWMNRPITQTLNEVPLAEGLRFILKSAGIENILLLYDDKNRVITVFDTENAVKQSAAGPSGQAGVRPPFLPPIPVAPAAAPPGQTSVQPPVVPPLPVPPPGDNPVLKRRTTDAGSDQTPGSRRTRRRNNQEEE
jgi:hypothetical protein